MAAAIQINDLLARCVLGVSDEERREKQDVLINITLYAQLEEAAATDDFARTLDYRDLKKRVLALVEDSRYHLLEALAERVADLCLEHELAEQVTVRVEKPSALRFARSVAVEVTHSNLRAW